MKKSKKLLSLVLALVMVFTMISGAIVANASTGKSGSAADNGPVLTTDKADAAGSIEAVSKLIDDYLPQILELIGTDTIEEALGLKVTKDTTIADILAALLPMLAPVMGGLSDDASNPLLTYAADPWERADNGDIKGYKEGYKVTGLSLFGVFQVFGEGGVADDANGMTQAKYEYLAGIIGEGTANDPAYPNVTDAQEYFFGMLNGSLTGTNYSVTNLPILHFKDSSGKAVDVDAADYRFSTMQSLALMDKWLNNFLANGGLNSFLAQATGMSLDVPKIINDLCGPDGFNIELRWSDIVNMTDGIFTKLGTNPCKALMTLLPDLNKIIDQLIVPLLIKEGDTAAMTASVLDLVDMSKMVGLDPVIYALVNKDFLPLDINKLLTEGYTYKNADGVVYYRYNAPVYDDAGKVVEGETTQVCLPGTEGGASQVKKGTTDEVIDITLTKADLVLDDNGNPSPVVSFASPLQMLLDLLKGTAFEADFAPIVEGLNSQISSGKLDLNTAFPDGLLEGLNYIFSSIMPEWKTQFPTGSKSFDSQFKAISQMGTNFENDDAAKIFDAVLDLALSHINPLLCLLDTAGDKYLSDMDLLGSVWSLLGGLKSDGLICEMLNAVLGNPSSEYAVKLPELNKKSIYYILSNCDKIATMVVEMITIFSGDNADDSTPANPAPEGDLDIMALLQEVIGLFKDDNGNFALPKISEANKQFAAKTDVWYPTYPGVFDQALFMDYVVKQIDIYLVGCTVPGYEYEGLLDTLLSWEITDEYTKKIFPNKAAGENLVEWVNTNVFTNKVVSAAVTGLYGTIENVAFTQGGTIIGRLVSAIIAPQKIAAIIGNDCGAQAYAAVNGLSGWYGSDLFDVNWGFEDGDVAGCISALAVPFRTLAPFLALLMSNSGLGLYKSVLLPIFETLGFTGTYTEKAFEAAEASGDVDIYIKALATPIVNFALDLLAAPVTQITNLIPRLAYFATQDTLTKIVRNVVTPIASALDTILGLVGNDSTSTSKGLSGDALGDADSFLNQLNSTTFDFDLIPVLNSVLALVINKLADGTPAAFTLSEVNWGQVAGLGEVTKLEADSTYNTIAVTHNGTVLSDVLSYVLDNVQDESNMAAISGIIAGLGLDAGTMEIVDMVLGMLTTMDKSDLFATVYDLLWASITVPGFDPATFMTPDTGDNSHMVLVTTASLASIAAIAFVVITGKKKKEDEEKLVTVR